MPESAAETTTALDAKSVSLNEDLEALEDGILETVFELNEESLESEHKAVKVTAEEKRAVQEEIDKIREFVKQLRLDDVKNGNWFEKLLAHSLRTYTQKVNAEYFREKYPNRPVDAVVQARIDLAARYAMIEGSLSSAAYAGAVVATIGSGGGASPLTLPAGAVAFIIDMTYLAQAQLKLAWDIAVLYNVPLDLDDPEDLLKFIKIAFTIKTGETVGNAAMKGVPAVIRPIIKNVFKGPTLRALKSLPVIGKYLLQRNIIKFAIPLVSVPTTAAVNYWSTKISGRHAKQVFRTEAKVREAAQRIADSTEEPEVLLWTIWYAMNANGTTSEQQHLIFDLLARTATERGVDSEALAELRDTIDIDSNAVLTRLAQAHDAVAIYKAALTGVALGKITPRSHETLEKIATASGVEYDPKEATRVAEAWSAKTPTKNKRDGAQESDGLKKSGFAKKVGELRSMGGFEKFRRKKEAEPMDSVSGDQGGSSPEPVDSDVEK